MKFNLISIVLLTQIILISLKFLLTNGVKNVPERENNNKKLNAASDFDNVLQNLKRIINDETFAKNLQKEKNFNSLKSFYERGYIVLGALAFLQYKIYKFIKIFCIKFLLYFVMSIFLRFQ